jgi:hypothetical protein
MPHAPRRRRRSPPGRRKWLPWMCSLRFWKASTGRSGGSRAGRSRWSGHAGSHTMTAAPPGRSASRSWARTAVGVGPDVVEGARSSPRRRRARRGRKVEEVARAENAGGRRAPRPRARAPSAWRDVLAEAVEAEAAQAGGTSPGEGAQSPAVAAAEVDRRGRPGRRRPPRQPTDRGSTSRSMSGAKPWPPAWGQTSGRTVGRSAEHALARVARPCFMSPAARSIMCAPSTSHWAGSAMIEPGVADGRKSAPERRRNEIARIRRVEVAEGVGRLAPAAEVPQRLRPPAFSEPSLNVDGARPSTAKSPLATPT